MRVPFLLAVLLATPVAAQDVTGALPRAGTVPGAGAAEDFDLSAGTRLPAPFPEFSVLWSPERFVAAPLGPYVTVPVRRTEPRPVLGILLSPQPLGDFAPLDRNDGSVAQR